MASIAEDQHLAQTTLADRTKKCLHLFNQCIQKLGDIPSLTLSQLEDQRVRFESWTRTIGAAHEGRASLDHRLRERPEVYDSAANVLDHLNEQIQKCLDALSSSDLASFDVSGTIPDGTFRRALRGVADEIGWLHKLSNSIVRSSRNKRNQDADREFRIKDDDGNDQELLLLKVFEYHMRAAFPSANEDLRQRLANTMLIRRRRILHRRWRHKIQHGHSQEHSFQPVRDKTSATVETSPPGAQLPMGKDEEVDIPVQAEAGNPRFHPARTVISATTLRSHILDRAASVASRTGTFGPGSNEILSFPPLPSLGISGDIDCPFCFEVLSREEVSDETQWKVHVMRDLECFVCLVEPCESAMVLYRSAEKWREHMKTHCLRWPCSRGHPMFLGKTPEDYINHLLNAHPRDTARYTAEDLEVMADHVRRPDTRIFTSCPLCGLDDISSESFLENHVVAHLQFTALKSISGYEHNEDEYVTSTIIDSRSHHVDMQSLSWSSSRTDFQYDLKSDRSLVLHDFGSDDNFLKAGARDAEWSFVINVTGPEVSETNDPILEKFKIPISESPVRTAFSWKLPGTGDMYSREDHSWEQKPRSASQGGVYPFYPKGWVEQNVSTYRLSWQPLMSYVYELFKAEGAEIPNYKSMNNDYWSFYVPRQLTDGEKSDIDKLRV